MNVFTSVTHTLAQLYPERKDAKRLSDEVGLNSSHIDLTGSALDIWSSMLTEADKQHRLDELLNLVKQEYPGHIDNIEFEQLVRSTFPQEVYKMEYSFGLLVIAGIAILGYILIMVLRG